jgi:hypothetical protein
VRGERDADRTGDEALHLPVTATAEDHQLRAAGLGAEDGIRGPVDDLDLDVHRGRRALGDLPGRPELRLRPAT